MRFSKKVLVMPGVESQVPLLKKLRQMGCRIFIIDPNDESPAHQYAERWLKANFFDYLACRSFAKEVCPDAVVSDQCDIATQPVADMAAYLGLPGIDPKIVPLFRNKAEMRRFAKEHDLNPIDARLCRSLNEARSFFAYLDSKMIIKPLDSNSSRGVYTIATQDELEMYFDSSMKWSISDKAVICERFIEGVEFTVDGIKIPGHGHKCLAISEKRHFDHNPNIACELYFSHRNEKFDYDALRALNNRYVDLSGLEFGTTHAEYKYEDGKFHLIEIGARGGGGYISSHIVPCMSGVDNLGILIRMSLGLPVEQGEISISPALKERCAVLKFFDFAAGKVGAINGESFLKSHPKVLDYRFNFKVGDTISKPTDDSKRVGYFIAYGDTSADLQALMQEIERRVTVEYARG